MTEKKDAIFLAHSFDKVPPPWSSVSDHVVSTWFENILKKRWRVLSGKSSQARPIGEKVADAVNESRAIVAVFTRKHQLDPEGSRFVPSPWVLCECAYALGRSRSTPNIVAGFREKGVDPESLALLTIGGMEYPEFDRDHLDDFKNTLQGYLNDLEGRIRAGNPGQIALPIALPYAQVDLHKIFLIYRNGYVTVQNITEIVIKDPHRFSQEYQSKIKHHIWTPSGTFPPLTAMQAVPVHRRKEEPFFHAILDYHGRKGINTALSIHEDQHFGDRISFAVGFLDDEGEPLNLKANDTIRYQYAWGLPEVFPTTEEQLEPIHGNIVDAATYCIADAEANHGPIDLFQLDLRFEREARGGEQKNLFSKSPFFSIGRGFGQPEWSEPRSVSPLKGEPEEYDMWYEIYRLELPKFDSRVRIAWRPSSKKRQEYQ
ncbi:MAG TPA: hypothetical protein VN956_03140 [Pyrinomonadaceae bacterium]|nr:hypothetical protein [Pyrinomonadaceae bacterium]